LDDLKADEITNFKWKEKRPIRPKSLKMPLLLMMMMNTNRNNNEKPSENSLLG
jgi:hypothetical protein